jgi:phenylalanyl-tRNA synthetase beta chain
MQISLKWLNELINIELINLNELIEKLTLGGFEVEEILELEIENQKQIVLDISATANRSDSLSIQGISTEIAILLNQQIKTSLYSLKKFNWQKKLDPLYSAITHDKNCSEFITVIIENITNHSVPKWIKQKLISSNIISVNSLLDFQNYILLETGYPFAFYDFHKISSKLNCSNFDLSFSQTLDNQEFLASNNISYELNFSNFVLKANDLSISIAGIIESKDYCYSKATTSILIEGSIFNAAIIRQQSRSLGLRTDRSARYEKSIKNTYLIESLYRLICLLRISNPNLTCKLHTIAQTPEQKSKSIFLHYRTVNEILGPIKQDLKGNLVYISPENITKYLSRLNFKFSYDISKLIWEVQISDARSEDITREIDLVEEIGRLYGFNNFLMTLPKIKNVGKEDVSYQTRRKITSCLTNLGLNEFIHYSLVKEDTFLYNDIPLINPLVSDYSNLRSSLIPNLILTVQENLKQGNLFIEGFEYGHVFLGNITTDLKEKEHVAGIFGGFKTKSTWSDSEKFLNWFEAKGKIEQLFKQLNLLIYWKPFLSLDNVVLHPYRSATLYLSENKKLGTFGQIHPILANKLTLSHQIYIFEFDIDLIQNQIETNKLTIYKEYSLYPKIIKDLSFIIHQDIQFTELETVLYSNGTKFLADINLLDEYKGTSIPDKYKSLCLQLTFQSARKTLENKKIENIMKNLELVLTNKFKAKIRT